MRHDADQLVWGGNRMMVAEFMLGEVGPRLVCSLGVINSLRLDAT